MNKITGIRVLKTTQVELLARKLKLEAKAGKKITWDNLLLKYIPKEG